MTLTPPTSSEVDGYGDAGPIVDLRTWKLMAAPRLSWGDPVTRLHFVIATVTTASGASGTGFTWTPHVGATAIAAMLRDDVAPAIVGLPTRPQTVWPWLMGRLREAGAGGVTTLATAAVDLALWDLVGRQRSVPVAELVGATADHCPAYRSGINFHFDDAELAGQVSRWVDDGAEAVKVKVGHENVGDDRRRVALVRSIIGPDCRLMVDANQRWDLTTALAAADRLGEYDLAWLEEPLPADDLDGYAELAARSPVPIALGENLYREHEFSRFLRLGACHFIQPNICRVGGITPYLRLATLAEEHGVPLVPHLLPEIAAPLMSTLSAPTMVELPDGALLDDLGVLAAPSPVRPAGSGVRIDARPGLGLEFVGG